MEITHKKYEGLSLIIVEGTLDQSKDSRINEILLNTSPGEARHLWVDCSDMNQIIYLNKSFSEFLSYLLQLKSQGVQILLFGLDSTTKRILNLLKLDTAFQQATTLDDAYLTLSRTLSVS